MKPKAETYLRVPRVPFRRLEDQTVIVDPKRREVHVLNQTGSAIWELLSETRTVLDLVAALEHDGEFDAGFATLETDLRGFLGELCQKGLITIEE